MKRSIHYLEYLYCHLLIVFLIGRVGFILNNLPVQHLSLLEAVGACWRGFLGHDLMVAAFLLAVPWVVSLPRPLQRRGERRVEAKLGECQRQGGRTVPPSFGGEGGGFWRGLLVPYYILMGLTVAAIIVADAVMYEYWQFKLSAVVLSYASSPEGTTNSVSLSYILVRVAAFLLLALWIIIPCIMLTPKSLPTGRTERLWMRNISIIWTFLLLSGIFFMRQGDVYGNPGKQIANHAAVNPVYAFFESINATDNYARRYDLLSEADRSDLFRGLYPEPADDIQDTLLRTRRPDVLVVFMESFGSRFVRELGGLPDVSPGWSRLIPEGIFWQNFYSNSFRTDRGTVSAFSGWMSYPDVGLMKQTEFHAALPSLARSLEREGYETAYLYGGAMTNMGKRQYLEDMDFRTLYDWTPENLWGEGNAWGLYDSISCQWARQIVGRWQGGRHFMVVQTISSHEPWDVPYHRLDDKILNAFAYTDHSVACMIDSLRRLPQWDNLLVVMLPDHGLLYRQTYDDPGFFRAPMLWLGGAVREPRRMDVLMNQSDLAATLLSQMGIRHDDYPWSRNVLSSSYTYPFVYCNYPAGLLFADSTGTSLYDLAGDVATVEQPSDDGLRILRAKAILQTSYDQLGEVRQSHRNAAAEGGAQSSIRKRPALISEAPRAYFGSASRLFWKRPALISDTPRTNINHEKEVK